MKFLFENDAFSFETLGGTDLGEVPRHGTIIQMARFQACGEM